MKRNLEDKIRADVDKKIVLLSGPRQVGKTTLAKGLYPGTSDFRFFRAAGEINRPCQKSQTGTFFARYPNQEGHLVVARLRGVIIKQRQSPVLRGCGRQFRCQIDN